MPNEELKKYASGERDRDKNDGDIKNSLLAAEWKEEDVNASMGFNLPQFEQFSVPTPTSHRFLKHRWISLTLYCIGGFVLLAVVILTLPITLGFIFRDGPVPDVSDLQLQKVDISDADNAYFYLTKLATAAVPVYENVSMGITIDKKPWDDNAVQTEVASDTAAYEIFSVAAHEPKFQDPAYADPANFSQFHKLPSLSPWRSTSRASAFHALYLVKQGKDKEAMEEALNPVRVGQKIEDAQGPLIYYLVGLAMKGVGLMAAQQVLVSSTLSNDELRQYIQELNQYSKNENGLVGAFKVDYFEKTQSIDDTVLGRNGVEKIRPNYLYQPNNMKGLLADGMRALIQNTNAGCKNEDIMMPAHPSSWIEMYTIENATGKYLSGLITSSLTSAVTKKCQEDVLVTTTQAMFAIKAFKNDTGNYPISLSDLVPTYLPSVPLDPYGGKQLGYSREKKIIYSIGPGMQDFGGSTGGDWHTMTNPTFILNF